MLGCTMIATSGPAALTRETMSNNLCSYNGATDGGTSNTATWAADSSWCGAVTLLITS